MDFRLVKTMTPDGDEVIRFIGEIKDREIAGLDLTALDRALMGDKHESASDYLLTLEMLFRRHEEQAKEKK